MFAKLYEKVVNWTSDKDHQVKLYDEENEMTTQSTCVFALKTAVMERWEAGDPIEMLYYGGRWPKPKMPQYMASLIVHRDSAGLFWVKKCTLTQRPPKSISPHDYAFLKTYTLPQHV